MIGIFRKETGRDDFPRPWKPFFDGVTGATPKVENFNMSVAAETNVEWDLKGIAVDTDREVVYSIAPTYDDEGAILILTASDLSLLGTIQAGNYRGIVIP